MRILCVHDDVATLEKYRRLGRTSDAGLDAFRSWLPDAVVSLVRLPAVDGVKLLTHVRDERAETIRIVVGDVQISEASLRSLKIAHRVIPESIGALDFVETLRRALMLRCVWARITARSGPACSGCGACPAPSSRPCTTTTAWRSRSRRASIPRARWRWPTGSRTTFSDPEDVRDRRAALPMAVITDPRWIWWREMAEQMALEGSTV